MSFFEPDNRSTFFVEMLGSYGHVLIALVIVCITIGVVVINVAEIIWS